MLFTIDRSLFSFEKVIANLTVDRRVADDSQAVLNMRFDFDKCTLAIDKSLLTIDMSLWPGTVDRRHGVSDEREQSIVKNDLLIQVGK